jgi:hypothetical protein
MKIAALTLALLTTACCNPSSLFAQNDSVHLDLGYVYLNRAYTQIISVKGADLEKMPFANLSDALSVWLQGAYTISGNLQYVVDGNPVSDVNAYSIEDIEEVILVQDASALMRTAGGQQQLVLIRTKRRNTPSGLTVTAQIGLVNQSLTGASTGTAFYHNYYAGGWRNIGKFSVGLSANYLRDVYPLPSTDEVHVTPNLQRFRLNGYVTWRPDSHNQLELTLNYTPETLNAAFDSLFGNQTSPINVTNRNTGHQQYMLPRLSWHSHIASGWSNDAQAVYIHSNYKEHDNSYANEPLDTTAYVSDAYDTLKSYHLWVRDHMAWSAKAGSWKIEPAFDLSYEHTNDQLSQAYTEIGIDQSGSNILAGSWGSIFIKSDVLLWTPSLDISYLKIFSVGAGMMLTAGPQAGNGNQSVFPFAHASLDLLPIFNESTPSSLKLFGSYAQRTFPTPTGYDLIDGVQGNDFSSQWQAHEFEYSGYKVPVYWAWETGITFSSWGQRLQIEYQFERRNYTTLAYVAPPMGGGFNYLITHEWKSSQHHADIRVKLIDGNSLYWQMGLNVTLLKSKTDSIYEVLVGNQIMGDCSPNKNSWTGGWTNRLSIKNVTAGFDLLYHFGEAIWTTNSNNGYIAGNVTTTGYHHSILTPNIYLGYRFNLSPTRKLEVYIQSRGLLQNTTSDLLDKRKYYTIGGKFNL